LIPARLLLASVTVAAATLLARQAGVDATGLPVVLGGTLLFVLVCEHIVPLLIVRHDPRRMLEVLLPSFDAVVSVFGPLTAVLERWVERRDRAAHAETAREGVPGSPAEPSAEGAPAPAADALQEGQARELLRSLVEFRETMVREVMTPRPDIVAIEAGATIGALRALAREQEYSRVPVYQDTLDNIVGVISIKDLILLESADAGQPITSLIRPAYFVPETKRVLELLKEFQRKRIQAALVVDEYGGTAGLVTLEDLLEEIVGEIRDEYDVEVEPVLEEPGGRFVFSGRTHVRELADRLRINVEGEGYETVGGYLLAHVGRVPAVGEAFEIDGLRLEVLEAERRRVTRVRAERLEREPAEAAERAG
jgi:CBS domain containing-hemolysin-like protein